MGDALAHDLVGVRLRLLEAHLTQDNLEEVLAAATGKSKHHIEELVARLAPQPPVPPSIRKLPERAPAVPVGPPSLPLPLTLPEAPPASMDEAPAPLPPLPLVPRRPEVKPLSAEAYRVEFTADRSLKAKLEKAEELMRHRVGKGNLVAVIEQALDLLIEEVTKERFGVGRKAHSTAAEAEQREEVSRHIPDAIKREVYERDGGQCTFVSEDGRRCEERGGLEFEHPEGFARTRRHARAELTLRCTAHNQYSADKLYGRTSCKTSAAGSAPARIPRRLFCEESSGRLEPQAAAPRGPNDSCHRLSANLRTPRLAGSRGGGGEPSRPSSPQCPSAPRLPRRSELAAATLPPPGFTAPSRCARRRAARAASRGSPGG